MADIYLGSTDLSSATFYLGSSAVSALYQGSTQVYSAGPAWVTDGLVQYIDPFASTISGTSVGSTASDLSGNGYSATIKIATLTTDSNGWVLGGSAGALLLGQLENTTYTSGLTFEIWFYVGSVSNNGPNMLNYRDPSDGSPNIAVQMTAAGESYRLNGWCRTSAGDLENKVLTGFPDSTWNHWVSTYSITGDQAKLYKNGSLAGTASGGIGDFTGGYYFAAGGPEGWNGSNFESDTKLWNSGNYMGLTRIYNRVLTSDEVTQNYNANKADYGL